MSAANDNRAMARAETRCGPGCGTRPGGGDVLKSGTAGFPSAQLALSQPGADFGRGEITVRGGKGGRDRRTVLPGRLSDSLIRHLDVVQPQRGGDVGRGAHQARELSLAPARPGHAPAGIGIGDPHRAGTARPRGRHDDHDLHARTRPRWAGGSKSGGRTVPWRDPEARCRPSLERMKRGEDKSRDRLELWIRCRAASCDRLSRFSVREVLPNSR